MAQAGCVVYVGNNGAAALKCGLVRPADRSDMVQVARQAGEGAIVGLRLPHCQIGFAEFP